MLCDTRHPNLFSQPPKTTTHIIEIPLNYMLQAFPLTTWPQILRTQSLTRNGNAMILLQRHVHRILNSMLCNLHGLQTSGPAFKVSNCQGNYTSLSNQSANLRPSRHINVYRYMSDGSATQATHTNAASLRPGIKTI